ncbi:Mis12 protein-domain-containing protein [Sordaria brevicollis]|uniref:Mis12 protein-domain-containing protein n=1 Tax=Sordaria brevicollis TaxID=83679 RepID=A0AAE0UF33_SORBR|nr:Mis12 protein-domain-containing protein [Sordaria brevicollis]
MATTTDTELLTEHFGYPPVSLLDDIINSINILAERALNSVEQGLLNAPPASLGFRPPTHAPTLKPGKKPKKGEENLPNAEEAHRHEIENGTHQLETLLCASIDRNFDKFEIYVMRNILCVRPEDRDWIRLGHYEGLDFSSPAKGKDGKEEQKPTIETVTHLRRRLQASQKLNVMLHAEKARNAALLAEVRRLVGSPKQIKSERSPAAQAAQQNGDTDTEMTDAPSTSSPKTDTKSPFAFLQQTSALSTSDASTPLTTTTAFTLSQLDALRSLSTSLRSLLPALSQPLPAPEPSETPESEEDKKKKPFRVQRLEYIETATRKHLEQVRGLELGANGELRDGGEWVGDVGEVSADGDGGRIKRRRVEREEVEALEGVLGGLGGGDAPGGKETREGQEEAEEDERGQEQSEQRQGEGQPHPQPEGQKEGEGTTETATPRRSRRSLGKQKAQGDGDGERMDES